jgi:hypothetical protein
MPTPSPTIKPTPAPTRAPAPSPTPQAATPQTSGIDLWIIAIIVVAVLIVIAIIAIIAARRTRCPADGRTGIIQPAAPTKAASRYPRDNMLAMGRINGLFAEAGPPSAKIRVQQQQQLLGHRRTHLD